MIVLQDEVNEKVVSLCIRGGKISAQILKASLQKLLREMEQSQKRQKISGKGQKKETVYHGKQSMEKWDHLQGLDISVIVGDTKTRIAALHHPAMIYVINRENIKWLVEYYEKNGMRWDFGMVVIDELSSFKNYQGLLLRFAHGVLLVVAVIVW